MSNLTELRKLSLEFRRLSSNLLNSNIDNADVNLSRFLKYINENNTISYILNERISDIDYDFKQCFLIDTGDWSEFNFPDDENLHLKAQYDYMTFIVTSEETNVRHQAMSYSWSDRDINNQIQKFADKAFKPLIDFINDQISMEMIVVEDTAKSASIVQNFGDNYGTINTQGSGEINSQNTVNLNSDILKLSEKILASLSDMTDISEDAIEDVKDDLESVTEQVKSPTPKKSRLQKALNGIKKFVLDVTNKAAVTLVAGAVTNADWNNLIEQIEMFIQSF